MKQNSWKNNRIWVLLIAGVLLTSGISVSEAYARYINEKRVQTQYSVTEASVTYAYRDNLEMIAAANFTGESEDVAEEIEVIEETTVESSEDAALTPETTPESDIIEEAIEETVTELETVDAIRLVSEWNETDPLLVELTFTSEYDQALLTWNGEAFPENMIYSVDGIKGAKLQTAGGISISGSAAHPTILILDFSETEAEKKEYSLEAVLSKDGTDIAKAELTGEYAEEAGWKPTLQGTEPVLRDTGNLRWNMEHSLEDSYYDVACEYLTIDGTYVNVSTPLDEQGEEEGIPFLLLSNEEEEKAAAGTYRVTITHVYEPYEGVSIKLQSVIIPFYVNYREP